MVRYHSLAVTGSPRRGGPRDRVDRRRGGDGHRAHLPPPVGRAVPSRVDLHRIRAQAVRELLPLAPESQPPRAGRLKRPSVPPRRCRKRGAAETARALHVRRIEGEADAEFLFERLFGDRSTLSGWTPPSTPPSSGSAPTSAPPWASAASRSNTTSESGLLTRHDAGESTTNESIFQALEREMRPSRRTRHESRPVASRAGSWDIWATSARPTAARRTRTARTCPTRCRCSQTA